MYEQATIQQVKASLMDSVGLLSRLKEERLLIQSVISKLDAAYKELDDIDNERAKQLDERI